MTHQHHHSHAGDHEHHVDEGAEHHIEEIGADECVGPSEQDGCCAAE